MAAPAGLGMGEIDYRTHCVQLATSVQALLEQPDNSEYRLLAQMMVDEYQAAIAKRDAPAETTNVVPLRRPQFEPVPLLGVAVDGDRGVEIRPFSLHDAIDEVKA